MVTLPRITSMLAMLGALPPCRPSSEDDRWAHETKLDEPRAIFCLPGMGRCGRAPLGRGHLTGAYPELRAIGERRAASRW
ncbi:hypothetical protein [Embleya sp. NPDC001921]